MIIRDHPCWDTNLIWVNLFSQVSLTVPGLPLLDKGESYSCVFKDVHSPAVVSRGRVSCQSPNPGSLPVVPLGQGEQLLDCLSVSHHDIS